MTTLHSDSYEKSVNVSCVNFRSNWGDTSANLEKMKLNIETAAALGSNFIVFPELALSGYECGEEARRDHTSCAMHRQAAETIPGPSTEEIIKLAKRHDLYVVLSMPERDRSDSNSLYISAPVIGPEGVVGVYRKLHLGPLPIWSEDTCFVAGDEIPVFETRYGPIGIQICADFWRFPEVTRILALKGARLIINPTASAAGPSKAEFIANMTMVRATENYIFTASACMVGTERTLSYEGHSTIAGPDHPRVMRKYAEAGDGEEIVSATLDFEQLEQWSLRHDWKSERRADLISQEFSKLTVEPDRLVARGSRS